MFFKDESHGIMVTINATPIYFSSPISMKKSLATLEKRFSTFLFRKEINLTETHCKKSMLANAPIYVHCIFTNIIIALDNFIGFFLLKVDKTLLHFQNVEKMLIVFPCDSVSCIIFASSKNIRFFIVFLHPKITMKENR